jgi:hypothetical protein
MNPAVAPASEQTIDNTKCNQTGSHPPPAGVGVRGGGNESMDIRSNTIAPGSESKIVMQMKPKSAASKQTALVAAMFHPLSRIAAPPATLGRAIR